MPKISAGILIYRKTQGTLQVFLVHPGGPYFVKKDLGDWSIPKGEIDENEELLACAVREVEEEIGLKLKNNIFIPLGSVTQKGGKIVHAWAQEHNEDIIIDNSGCMFEIEWPPRSGKRRKFPEVDKGEFFDVTTAKLKIKEAQKEFIEKLEKLLGAESVD